MIWLGIKLLGIKLLGIGRWLKEAATVLFGAIRAHPWPALVIALLLALAWTWHGKTSALGQRDAAIAGRAADRKAYVDAEAEAAAMAMAQLIAQETRYKTKAKEADNAYTIQLASANDAGERYIASHRVRPQSVGSPRGKTAAPGESGGSGIPASMPADAVMVSAADVRVCTAVTTYALGAHNWAASLGD